MAQLRFIVLSDSLAFQSFSVVFTARTGELVEYVGAARRLNGVAEVAALHVWASATLRPQYTQQARTAICAPHIWGGMGCFMGMDAHQAMQAFPNGQCAMVVERSIYHCSSNNVLTTWSAPRGLYPDELNRAAQVMRAAAYQRMVAILG